MPENKSDNKTKEIKIASRSELIKKFMDGNIPEGKDFELLINSVMNLADDGLTKDEENGIQISPIAGGNKYFSLYDGIDKLKKAWLFICRSKSDNPGIHFGVDKGAYNNDHTISEESDFLYLNLKDLNIGIGTSTPYFNSKLQVDGFASIYGRIGNNLTDKMPVIPLANDLEERKKNLTDIPQRWFVPADGKWYDITSDLDNCQAYEVTARAGSKTSKKFAMAHAIALNVNGKNKCIRRTSTHIGFLWNKIKFRWYSQKQEPNDWKTPKKYRLQIKTQSNFDKNALIYYSIIKLWDDQFLPSDERYEQQNNETAGA